MSSVTVLRSAVVVGAACYERAVPGQPDPVLDLLWLTLPESRPGRELDWLASMPGARVRAVGERPTGDDVAFVARRYRRLTRRFVEAGALAWFRDLGSVAQPGEVGWVASLELCALVTGQAAPLARRLGARQAVLTWGNDPRNPLYRLPPYRQALGRARGADLVVCLIEAARDHCLDLGFAPEQLAVVLPPLDVERFRPPEVPVAEPVAGFVSPLAPNKGIDRVLDAWPLVRRRVPEARLLVAGRGPLEGLVRERAAEDPSIELVGSLTGDEVARLLGRLAVFVTAPRPTAVWNEQFGLAYVEAMATGVPVVTTVCGTNHEAVLPPSIRVPDEVGALADGLVHFLDDPALRRRLAPQLRAAVVERFERRQQLAALRAAFDAVS
ncbi:MAG: glycosyltransferase family 4 protein [Acidimicrobiales bacterium]|nr:glycosyltransferase family 4 protein [Acidimicrobiales bacterium]HRW37080.1 glycosyltransferase family 4 protein [Aquihabitans sp.]